MSKVLIPLGIVWVVLSLVIGIVIINLPNETGNQSAALPLGVPNGGKATGAKVEPTPTAEMKTSVGITGTLEEYNKKTSVSITE